MLAIKAVVIKLPHNFTIKGLPVNSLHQTNKFANLGS